MIATVSRLRSRAVSYDEAVAAYRKADLATVVAGFRHELGPAAANLRARIFLRADDARSALDALDASAGDGFAIVGERAMLRGAACTRLGDIESASREFGAARVPVLAAAVPALEAELAYYEALAAFVSADHSSAHDALDRSLHATKLSHASESATPYPVPLAHTEARVYELRGAFAVARDDYAEQLVETDRALAALDAEPIDDAWIRTRNLANLAVLVRDFGLIENVPPLVAAAQSMPPVATLGPWHYLITGAVGWCAALAGDQLGALRWFRRACDVARDVPDSIEAEIDLAWLAIEFERYGDAAEAVDRAVALAEAYDWSDSGADRLLALVTLAQGAAAYRTRAARRALDTYRRTRARFSMLDFAHLERRVRAEVAFAEGVVARAEGRVALAIDRLVDAFETWTAIGYGWRAARAAIELDELGCGSRYAAYAHRYARANPTSCIARRAAACGSRPDTSRAADAR